MTLGVKMFCAEAESAEVAALLLLILLGDKRCCDALILASVLSLEAMTASRQGLPCREAWATSLICSMPLERLPLGP